MFEKLDSFRPEGECGNYKNFLKAVEKLYLDRKGKRKLKSQKSKKKKYQTKIRCDFIISVEDQKIFAWPSSSSPSLIVLTLSLQGEGTETWIEAINGLANLYKRERMLPPIRFNYVKERGKYLKGFLEDYEVFEQLIDRLYVKRPGRNNDIRCDILVSEQERAVWAWPNKSTDNLIAFCWYAEDVDKEEWEERKESLKKICEKHDIVYLNFSPFNPD